MFPLALVACSGAVGLGRAHDRIVPTSVIFAVFKGLNVCASKTTTHRRSGSD
jgi:hypothetical protein